MYDKYLLEIVVLGEGSGVKFLETHGMIKQFRNSNKFFHPLIFNTLQHSVNILSFCEFLGI